VGTSPAPQSALATSKDRPSSSFYGLAIGFTVMAGALAVGAISRGDSLNI
jgi:glycerol uptake facilitator-like aquaporin